VFGYQTFSDMAIEVDSGSTFVNAVESPASTILFNLIE